MSDPLAWSARTTRILWGVFGAALAGCLAAEAWVGHKDYFGIAGIPGFYAGFGFLSCFVLVILARALGALLKRRDTYYDD